MWAACDKTESEGLECTGGEPSLCSIIYWHSKILALADLIPISREIYF